MRPAPGRCLLLQRFCRCQRPARRCSPATESAGGRSGLDSRLRAAGRERIAGAQRRPRAVALPCGLFAPNGRPRVMFLPAKGCVSSGERAPEQGNACGFARNWEIPLARRRGHLRCDKRPQAPDSPVLAELPRPPGSASPSKTYKNRLKPPSFHVDTRCRGPRFRDGSTRGLGCYATQGREPRGVTTTM